MSKFAFTADLHLRACVWAGKPTLRDDAYVAATQIFDRCIADNINLVIGGDAFDRPKQNSDEVLFLTTQVQRMRDAGLSVFGLNGNHDPQWIQSIYGIIWVHNRVFEPAPGIRSFGLDYTPAAELQPLLARAVPPDTEVLFLHQMMDWAFPMEGVWNCKEEWFPGFVKLVLIGDYHAPVEHIDPRGIRSAYPGSVAMQALNEEPHKSFMIVEKRPDGTYDFQRVPLQTRPFSATSLNSEEQFAQLTTALDTWLASPLVTAVPETIRKPILRITYAADLPNADARIRQLIGDRVHLWTSPWSLNQAQAAYNTTSEAAENVTVAGVLAELVDAKSHARLFQLLVDLLTRNNTDQVLLELRRELGIEEQAVPLPTTGATV